MILTPTQALNTRDRLANIINLAHDAAAELEEAFKANTTASSPASIYREIMAERTRQDAQWGGPTHDDQHTDYDWWRFRRDFEDKVIHGPVFSADDLTMESRKAKQRANLIKIAALAVAQIESLERRGFR